MRRRIAQACVIPFRRHGDDTTFCLITSLKKKRWIFPKGIIDPGETLEESALKEALEEAGLHGQIVGEPLGTYNDAKWGTKLHVAVVLMEVTVRDEQWPEADVRRRCWVAAEEAPRLPNRQPVSSLSIFLSIEGIRSDEKCRFCLIR